MKFLSIMKSVLLIGIGSNLPVGILISMEPLRLDDDRPTLYVPPRTQEDIYQNYGIDPLEKWRCPNGTIHPYKQAAWEECEDNAVQIQ